MSCRDDQGGFKDHSFLTPAEFERLHSDDDEEMPRLVWTSERPTKPGFYWKKPTISGDPFMVRVELTPHTASGISASLCDRDFLADLNCWGDSEWAGPLEPPQ